MRHLGDGRWRQHSLARRRHSLRANTAVSATTQQPKEGIVTKAKVRPSATGRIIEAGHVHFRHPPCPHAETRNAWSCKASCGMERVGGRPGSVKRSRNISRLNSRCRQDSDLHRRRGRHRFCGKRQRQSGGRCRWRRRRGLNRRCSGCGSGRCWKWQHRQIWLQRQRL